ncbi:MAG TPA: YihY/virulence factor BrkB family protein [Actinomycetes bacterium]|jgi:membrane protein|nr:YihY/virulence factor BrkB family protein [Actinomycetes bacterium]
MAKVDAEPRGPEARIEQAIARLYRWLAGNRYTRFPWAVVQTFSRAEGTLLSGSMAYYTFLSLLPLLMVAAFVLGTFLSGEPEAPETVANALNQVFPGIGSDVFNEVITQIIENRGVLGVFGLLSTFYAGSGFVGAMTACMNRMWEVPTGRNPVGQKIVNILIVVMLGSVLLGSALLTIWVSATAQRTLDIQPTSPVIELIEELAGPSSMLIVLLLLYRLLPARRHSWLSQLPGAGFGAVGFYLLKRGFDYWAGQSAGIGALPRSLVSVVLLLVWLGFFGQLILYGAALNVVLDRRGRGESIMPNVPGLTG